MSKWEILFVEGQGCDTCDADASKQGRGITLVPRVQTANSLSNDLDKYDSTTVGLVWPYKEELL